MSLGLYGKVSSLVAMFVCLSVNTCSIVCVFSVVIRPDIIFFSSSFTAKSNHIHVIHNVFMFMFFSLLRSLLKSQQDLRALRPSKKVLLSCHDLMIQYPTQ